jgi:hypothetical protein
VRVAASNRPLTSCCFTRDSLSQRALFFNSFFENPTPS